MPRRIAPRSSRPSRGRTHPASTGEPTALRGDCPVFDLRQAFKGSDEDRRVAFRALLAERRMRVCAVPSAFGAGGMFELPGDSGPCPRAGSLPWEPGACMATSEKWPSTSSCRREATRFNRWSQVTGGHRALPERWKPCA